MSDPAASTVVRCSLPTCPTPPVWYVVGRCLTCREELPQRVCGEHRDTLVSGMFMFNVLSNCHGQPVTLVRLEPLT